VSDAAPRRILILGAAGRDFHVFNVVYRDDPATTVVAFTATQIPGIADRTYPPSLAGPRYPAGIPILPETSLEALIRSESVDGVVFAYSDVSHETVMHLASRSLAAGADFLLLGPHRTMLRSTRPVVAIGATRTGAGKSQTARHVAERIEAHGACAVVVRHPMPYGDLERQAVQRFASLEDLERHRTTIEEREEYEPHLAAGRVVYAGVDYEAILRRAEAEADVVIWDGGNNDFPFFQPDLYFVIVDPLRAGDERHYHPGEANLRMADVVVINKVDVASPEQLEAVHASIDALDRSAAVVTARSELRLVGPPIAGRRVVVVEDGPTLTHGGMTFGAGIVAARRFGATVVDPRPAATGSIRAVLAAHPNLEPLIPAMGYGEQQMHDLEETLNAAEADLVLAATPIDLTRILRLRKPVTRVAYDLLPVGGPSIDSLLGPILVRAGAVGAR
jgi:predicted GTPase